MGGSQRGSCRWEGEAACHGLFSRGLEQVGANPGGQVVVAEGAIPFGQAGPVHEFQTDLQVPVPGDREAVAGKNLFHFGGSETIDGVVQIVVVVHAEDVKVASNGPVI